MKKRFLAFILLCVSVMFVFAGCGGNDGLTQAEINKALRAYSKVFEQEEVQSMSSISIDDEVNDLQKTPLENVPIKNPVNFFIEITASDKFTGINTKDIFKAEGNTYDGDVEEFYFAFDYKDGILKLVWVLQSDYGDWHWNLSGAAIEYDKDTNIIGNWKWYSTWFTTFNEFLPKISGYYIFDKNKATDVCFQMSGEEYAEETKNFFSPITSNVDKAVDTKANYTEELEKAMRA